MTELRPGDSFPEGVEFSWAPYQADDDVAACGMPQQFNASKEFANKKIVLVAVPGAFTPTCQANHLSGYISHLQDLKAKGVDQVIVIASNDVWVMAAWGKANGIKDDSILFMSDTGLAFCKKIGWFNGEKAARFAIVIDHGKVVYSEKEPVRGVDVSGVEAVLANL